MPSAGRKARSLPESAIAYWRSNLTSATAPRPTVHTTYSVITPSTSSIHGDGPKQPRESNEPAEQHGRQHHGNPHRGHEVRILPVPTQSRNRKSSDVVRNSREPDQEQKGKGEQSERHEHEKGNADDGDDHHDDHRNQHRKEQQLNQQSDRAGFHRLAGGAKAHPLDIPAPEQQNDRRQDAEHGQPRHREDEREERAEADRRAEDNIVRATPAANRLQPGQKFTSPNPISWTSPPTRADGSRCSDPPMTVTSPPTLACGPKIDAAADRDDISADLTVDLGASADRDDVPVDDFIGADSHAAADPHPIGAAIPSPRDRAGRWAALVDRRFGQCRGGSRTFGGSGSIRRGSKRARCSDASRYESRMITSASAPRRRCNSAPVTGSPSIAIAPPVSSMDRISRPAPLGSRTTPPCTGNTSNRCSIRRPSASRSGSRSALCAAPAGDVPGPGDQHRQQNGVHSTHDHSSSAPSSRCSQ